MKYNLIKLEELEHLIKSCLLYYDKSSTINTYNEVEYILKNNGYISGGFSALIGYIYFLQFDRFLSKRRKHTLNSNLVNEKIQIFKINAEIFNSRYGIDDVLSEKNKHCFKKQDIDFFFKNENDYNNIINYINNNKNYSYNEDFISNNAKEFIFNKTHVIQLIHKEFGLPEDVIINFDIINAMTWIDKEGFHYSDEWLTLLNKKILKLNYEKYETFEKASIITRSIKWADKLDLNRIDEKQENKFYNNVFSIFKKLKKLEDPKERKWFVFYKNDFVKKSFKLSRLFRLSNRMCLAAMTIKNTKLLYKICLSRHEDY